ncbi:MAG: deoxyribonucleotidase [uncultured marine phage]|uniref:Deoxyribonucleotidase n=1 Tax=uncultured marine phage TaxID=707152 RepID=A0A8D9CAS6_9VIRU|nr:MAG: deoxyribonucleotidase [uncultured marine phage]
MKKDLLFDMDGVLCDYMKRHNLVKEIYDIEYPQSQQGFFTRLDPMEGAIEAFNKLRDCGKYNCYILTRPSVKNIHCYTEKAEWIRNYLGEDMLEHLIIACDKSKVKGDYLIDDVDVHGQSEFEGEHIHFAQEEFPNWDSVLEYLL